MLHSIKKLSVLKFTQMIEYRLDRKNSMVISAISCQFVLTYIKFAVNIFNGRETILNAKWDTTFFLIFGF